MRAVKKSELLHFFRLGTESVCTKGTNESISSNLKRNEIC